MNVAVVFAACVAAACGSSTEPLVEERIEGEWNWVESTGGFAGTTQTPASTGQTMRLHFDDNEVELYRDGQFVTSTGYSIAAKTETEGERVLYDLAILGFESQAVSFQGEDVLLLTDPCCDGFAYRFERD